MTTEYQHRLALIQNSAHQKLFHGICHGIERESLRVRPDATLSRTAHPEVLGRSLTHPYITTDYSEALLEFITPVHCRIDDTFDFLDQLHRYTCQSMDGEVLWAGSMPALLDGDDSIPIAQYGHSNIGLMKSVYREGLAHRYGKSMQTIAGIHYNFSLPTEFWSLFDARRGASSEENQACQSEGYFALIRNFRRYSWLLMYLFGASPAVSRSFFPDRGERSGLQVLDSDTLFLPYATSLRMSDLGYTNNAQSSLSICYNTLGEYVNSLSKAIHTPYPPYENIGLKREGKYLQLNTNLLQIENEYYSTIRPKRIARSGEKPITALRNKGVEYIEVRCLDINPLEPLGLNRNDAHFLDTFLVYCALQSQLPIEVVECAEVTANFNKTVLEGRRPGMTLVHHGKPVSLRDWGMTLLDEMCPVAEMLDAGEGGSCFSDALTAQRNRLLDASLTPSARLLGEMQEKTVSYIDLVMSLSQKHFSTFAERPLGSERQSYFQQIAARSRADQAVREQEDDTAFDVFLSDYMAEK